MTEIWTIIVTILHVLSSVNGQTSTSSYFPKDSYLDNQYKYGRSKYYYFFTPPSQARSLGLEPVSDNSEVLEDRNYDSYVGYEAQWPQQNVQQKVIHQPDIHVHHTVPYKSEKSENSYLLPLLLLAFLPFLLGALVLLPLLFTFFTNLLQLLALIQQTVANLNNGNNNTQGRRKRQDESVNPVVSTTIATLVDMFMTSQDKYSSYSD